MNPVDQASTEGTFRGTTEFARRVYRDIAALYAGTQILAEGGTLAESATAILRGICELAGWELGNLWLTEENSGELELYAWWTSDEKCLAPFIGLSRQSRFAPSVGLPGRVLSGADAHWISDVAADKNFPRSVAAAECGLNSAIGFPLASSRRVYGVFEFFTREQREPDQEVLLVISEIGRRVGQILESRDAHVALQRSEERFRNIVDTAQEGIWVLDPDGTTTYANRRLGEMLRCAPAEMLGRNLLSYVPAHLSAEAENHLEERRQGHSGSYDFTFNRCDGTELLVMVSSSPLIEDGEVRGILKMIVDITSRKTTEIQLAESKAALDSAQALGHIGSWEWDIASNSVSWSDELCRLYQVEPEGFVATYERYLEYIHADDVALVTEAIGHTFASGEPFMFEHRLVRPDGSTVFLECRGKLERGPDGQPLRMTGTAQDVTPRKDAEDALRFSLAKLRQVVDTALDAVVSMDTSGRVTEWNPRCVALFGWKREEALGRTVSELIIPERYRAAHAAGLRRYLATGEGPVINQVIEIEALHRDGHELPVELSISAPADENGDRIFTAFLRDITERRAAQQALRESEERFALAIQGTSEGLWDIDLASGSVYCSPRLIEMIGLDGQDSNDELIKSMEGRIHPEDMARAQAAMENHLRSDSPYLIDLRIADGEGNYRWFRSRGRAVRDATGTPVRMVGFLQDITDQLLLEQRVRNTYKLEAIGRLAGGIAHDFNNILYALLGYAEFVRDDVEPGSEAHQNIGLVLKAGKRAKELVQHILAFSRQSEVRMVPVSMDQIVIEALNFLKATLPSTIELRQNIETSGVIVDGDPTQMHQVVINLCTNAAHAMGSEPGVLEVVLRPIEIDSDFASKHVGLGSGPHVLLSVTDNGHGIPDGVADRIFDPFFTTKGPGEGTGMGLALVHGIVTSHGGAINLYSEPNLGTTFNIYLPRSTSSEQEATAVTPTVARGTERILLVDDEPDIVDMAGKMLGRMGYQVTGVTSSERALALFSENPAAYDLVLTDQTMPKMTGEHLADELVKLRPGIPIILCTGFSLSIQDESRRHRSVWRYLMKPLVSSELGAAVREVLELAPSAGSSAVKE